MQLTLASFINFWRKAKEFTACYPSKFSFATLKASSQDNKLAKMDCIMMRIPLNTGVDVMIPKKTNKTDIDNLRTICLFEVDANFGFKHIGR
jgi:hypothetical protein